MIHGYNAYYAFLTIFGLVMMLKSRGNDRAVSFHFVGWAMMIIFGPHAVVDLLRLVGILQS